jgi:hypothetical protein
MRVDDFNRRFWIAKTIFRLQSVFLKVSICGRGPVNQQDWRSAAWAENKMRGTLGFVKGL